MGSEQIALKQGIVEAWAKVNLGLWVGPRHANGLHPVRSVMQTVCLGDILQIQAIEGEPSAVVWETSHPQLQWTPQNIVFRTVQWLRQHRRLPRLRITLTKRIPLGAGLAGGSADAAAVVRWVLNQQQYQGPDWLQTVSDLGQDIPFLLVGGTADVSGYGAIVRPLPPLKEGAVVLTNPGFEVSTAAVYAAFDQLQHPNPSLTDWDFEALIATVASGHVPTELPNSLENAAFAVAPPLRAFRDRLQSVAIGSRWYLSGSGATYYTVGPDREWAEWLAERLRLNGIPWVEVTRWRTPYS